MGERQMLPVQTKTTRKGSTALAVMRTILARGMPQAKRRACLYRSPPGHDKVCCGSQTPHSLARRARPAGPPGGTVRRSVRLPVFASVGAVVIASLAAASPAAAAAAPVINEFSASTAGTDVEYIELLAAPGADLSGYRVLQIEGDAPDVRRRRQRPDTRRAGRFGARASLAAGERAGERHHQPSSRDGDDSRPRSRPRREQRRCHRRRRPHGSRCRRDQRRRRGRPDLRRRHPRRRL